VHAVLNILIMEDTVYQTNWYLAYKRA